MSNKYFQMSNNDTMTAIMASSKLPLNPKTKVYDETEEPKKKASIKFPRCCGGSLDIDISVRESATHSESLDKNQYDYRDGSGLSFQKISKTRVLIADPAYPITKQIV